MRAKVSVLVALIVIIAVGGITIGLSGGSSKSSAKVLATTAPSPSATVSVSPKPSVTHHAPIARTPGPNRPTGRIASTVPVPVRTAVTAKPAVCHLPAGAQSLGGRAVFLDLPTHFPAPVVIDFHGGNQSAAQEHAYTGLGTAGSSAGFVVVTPNGTNGLWNFPGTEALPDDVAFTQHIAYALAISGCSNGALYTAGISDGADMAVAAGCRVAAVRAVFAVAPSITPRGVCTRKSFAEVHGTSDPIVPYTGSAQGSFSDTPSVGVQQRLPFWTSGCSGPVNGAAPATGTQVNDWICPGGRSVRLYTVNGGGHTWPGAVGHEPVAGLGARAVWSADTAALAFFSTH